MLVGCEPRSPGCRLSLLAPLRCTERGSKALASYSLRSIKIGLTWVCAKRTALSQESEAGMKRWSSAVRTEAPLTCLSSGEKMPNKDIKECIAWVGILYHLGMAPIVSFNSCYFPKRDLTHVSQGKGGPEKLLPVLSQEALPFLSPGWTESPWEGKMSHTLRWTLGAGVQILSDVSTASCVNRMCPREGWAPCHARENKDLEGKQERDI